MLDGHKKRTKNLKLGKKARWVTTCKKGENVFNDSDEGKFSTKKEVTNTHADLQSVKKSDIF